MYSTVQYACMIDRYVHVHTDHQCVELVRPCMLQESLTSGLIEVVAPVHISLTDLRLAWHEVVHLLNQIGIPQCLEA